MYVMYDDTSPGLIPASATAVAGYVGGRWPNYAEDVKRWPHAHHLSIAVNASEDADCLDVENGDATPQDCPGWFHRQIARGIRRKPVFYGSLSVVPQVEAALGAAGIQRDEYLILSAHYTYVPHVCGTACGLTRPADGTQWTDKALGRSLDESLLQDDFFHAVDPLAVLTPEERQTVERYDRLKQHPHLHGHALAQTEATLIRFRKETWLAAVKGLAPNQEHVQAGWGIHNRRRRYEILLSRTR